MTYVFQRRPEESRAKQTKAQRHKKSVADGRGRQADAGKSRQAQARKKTVLAWPLASKMAGIDEAF